MPLDVPNQSCIVMDVCFLVDSSGSVCDGQDFHEDGSCDNWRMSSQFLKDFINDPRIKIGPDDVKVGSSINNHF